MKRPRWLGGRETDEGEDGGDAAVKSAKGKPESEGDGVSAAERSARRTARKTLGDRVGKAAGSDDVEPEEKVEAKSAKASEPKSKRRPRHEGEAKAEADPVVKAKAKADAKIKAKANPAPKVKAKSGSEDDKSELHRPRRQKDEKADPPPPRAGQDRDKGKAGRSRDHDKSERAGKAGKAVGSSKVGESTKAARKPLGPRVRAAAAGSAKAMKRGAGETRRRIAAVAPKVGRRGLALLGAVFAIFFELLAFVLNILIAIGLFVARPIGWILSRLSRFANAASRLLTPTRVLALVVAGAAVLLALSQYADYRSISIGNDAYAGVQNIAPPPETGRLQTGDAHSYVFVPIAILCLLLLGGALTGRWRLCRLITVAGAAAIVVAFAVDRAAGLDTGDTALAFDGVRATLLGGFYAQIAAGVLLIGSSSLLARELRLAAVAETVRPRRGRKRSEGKRTLRRPPDHEAGGVRA